MQKIFAKYHIQSYNKCTDLLNILKYLRCGFSSSTCMGLQGVEPANSGTMIEVGLKIREIMGLTSGYNREPQKRDHLLKYTPKREDLPPRNMSDSYVKATIPLSIYEEMHLKYITPIGTVRLGRLMEQLDLFAVWVCYQHVCLPKLPPDEHIPYTFVTILVDKMTFPKELPMYNQDIKLSGFVSWVGNTSLEISVWLEQNHQNGFRLITQAVFLMGARNATNTTSAPINYLQLCNDKEKYVFNLGEQRRQRRRIVQETSIFKIKPTEQEHAEMYDIYKATSDKTSLRLNNRLLPPDCQWMQQSFVENTFLSFPENSNVVNTVFGGFLMRQSFEISWMCAFLHCGHRPACVHSCDITFGKPVEISSLIKMTAYIVYTEDNLMQIMTLAEILDPVTRSAVTSNIFYYTFASFNKIKSVLPKSYHESIWYIHGKRKFVDAIQNIK